jgi:hypothetical protein
MSPHRTFHVTVGRAVLAAILIAVSRGPCTFFPCITVNILLSFLEKVSEIFSVWPQTCIIPNKHFCYFTSNFYTLSEPRGSDEQQSRKNNLYISKLYVLGIWVLGVLLANNHETHKLGEE